MTSDSRAAWSRFDAAAIPTKTNVEELHRFLERVRSNRAPKTALDLGCGTGGIAAALLDAGLAVVGVDLNAAALEAAQRVAPGARFHLRDAAGHDGLRLDGEGPFDIVVCQLVVSIVGTPADREQLLRNAAASLAPDGWLFVSASGRSDDINPGYAALYAQDRAASGEDGTYFSRDAAGNVLYATHHFTEVELRELLTRCGFADIEVTRRLERSSRRPAEAAWFFYGACRTEEK